jgi:orotidine-5'-phosphate decarboxylase
MTPLDRLRARTQRIGAPLCIGIDPHPDRLPASLPRDARGIERFAAGIVRVAAEHATAVKLNVAFFEALGADGLAALERVRRSVPDDLFVILDAKRGDIGSTAERYAEALFGRMAADAVTLSPYLGEDAIVPFLRWPDRCVYVLARTSNPDAARFQGLLVDGEPLSTHVARWVSGRWTDGRAGLVVGATDAGELAVIRRVAPGPAFLVPGVGAQGGDLDAAVRACHGTWAPGVVAVSRSVAEASTGDDWEEAAHEAAGALRGRMAEAVLHSGPSAAAAATHGGS